MIPEVRVGLRSQFRISHIFAVAGAMGEKGMQGATGVAGRANNVPNTRTSTTPRPHVPGPSGPCSGPAGEDVCFVYLRHLRMYRTLIYTGWTQKLDCF